MKGETIPDSDTICRYCGSSTLSEETGIVLSFKSIRYGEFDFSFNCKGEIDEKHEDILEERV